MHARNLAASLALVTCGLFAPPATAGVEDVLVMQLLDNPSFEEGLPEAPEGSPAQVPWWRSTQGADQLLTRELEDGTKQTWLWVKAGVSAEQPLAAYGPTAGGIVITAHVSGSGRVVIVDGAGREHVERFVHGLAAHGALASREPRGLHDQGSTPFPDVGCRRLEVVE